ncbi:hypothetical protein Dimus_022458 [Dionaea muscipula]
MVSGEIGSRSTDSRLQRVGMVAASGVAVANEDCSGFGGIAAPGTAMMIPGTLEGDGLLPIVSTDGVVVSANVTVSHPSKFIAIAGDIDNGGMVSVNEGGGMVS